MNVVSRIRGNALLSRMLAGGVGPLSSFLVLVFLPVAGAFFLSADEFAIWALLNSVATLALSLDFGGAAYVGAASGPSRRAWRIALTGTLMSGLGAVLIGAVAAIAWIPYSSTAGAAGWSVLSGELGILAITIAGVLRSATAVLSAAALARFDYVSRNILLTGQAGVAVIITIVCLALLRTAWALPIGWIAASVISISASLPSLIRSMRPSRAIGIEKPPFKIGTFTLKRTAATLLGGVLLQGDRWVVGALGGPAFLAGYELAWRFASAPRLVALSVTASLLPDVASQDLNKLDLSRVLRSAGRSTWILEALTSIASVAAILACVGLGKLDWTMAAIGALLILSLGANGRSSVTTLTGIARGFVGIDLPYLAAALSVTCLGWAIGSVLGAPIIVVLLSNVALLATSLIFVRVKERSLVRDSLD